MIILGIETSCDETAAAIVRNGCEILSNVISTQIDYHKKYGGIVPEIASRKHQENIIPVVREALDRAGMRLGDIQGMAVTQGPGLIGSLLVGVNAAKAIAYARSIPLVGVNHLEGHMLAPHLEYDVPFPNITLVVSGGHTNIYYVEKIGSYRLLGKTRDDAAGEAYDKVAKLLGLGYPGGVVIDKLAQNGNPAAFAFPRPMLHDASLDFSFSGLKTAVLYCVKNNYPHGVPETVLPDLAASFQQAVVDLLIEKTLSACGACKARAVAITGGVAANSRLRLQMQQRAQDKKISLYLTSPVLCTDNAAMIAKAGSFKLTHDLPFPYEMNAISRWPLHTMALDNSHI